MNPTTTTPKECCRPWTDDDESPDSRQVQSRVAGSSAAWLEWRHDSSAEQRTRLEAEIARTRQELAKAREATVLHVSPEETERVTELRRKWAVALQAVVRELLLKLSPDGSNTPPISELLDAFHIEYSMVNYSEADGDMMDFV